MLTFSGSVIISSLVVGANLLVNYFVGCGCALVGHLYFTTLFMDRNTFSKSWKVFCWNVRGINSDKKWVSIRDKITESNCDIVCLQETKMEHLSQRIVLSVLGSTFSHDISVPSVGASGGILVAWTHDLGPARSTRVDT